MSIQNIVAEDTVRLQCFAYATLESFDSTNTAQSNSYDAAFLAF